MRDTVISILITAFILCGLFIMTASVLFRAVKGTAIIRINEPGTYIFHVIRDNGATPADFNMPEKRSKK